MSRSMDRLFRARPDITDAIDRDALFAQIVADSARTTSSRRSAAPDGGGC